MANAIRLVMVRSGSESAAIGSKRLLDALLIKIVCGYLSLAGPIEKMVS
jgi:hypothetical protein